MMQMVEMRSYSPGNNRDHIRLSGESRARSEALAPSSGLHWMADQVRHDGFA
jgi:hypothetical protein